MKRIAWVLLAAAAVWLGGCVLTSVYPYYSEKDVVFEPALAGDWLHHAKDAPDELWEFWADSGARSYSFMRVEPRNATTQIMDAHLFKLQGQLFLDIATREQDYQLIPSHYLLKVSRIAPTLRVSLLDHQWFQSLLATNPAAIRHHFVKTGDKPEERRVVLTADTAELQDFIVRHLKTEGMWQESFELTRATADTAK